MTDTNPDMPLGQLDDNELRDRREPDEIDFIDHAVAGITDADIERRLRNTLGRAGYGHPHRSTSQASSGPAPRSGPLVLRLLLGAQLRRLREAGGVTREEAGDYIRASSSVIARMELGRALFRERDVMNLLAYYGVHDPADRDRLIQLIKEANAPFWEQRFAGALPDWWDVYVGLEEAAQSIRSYEPHFVPGLLQTEEYTHAVVTQTSVGMTAYEVDRRLQVQSDRQKLLTRENPPRLWAVVDEAALRRPVSGPHVHLAQLQRLIDAVDEPNITLQVVPFRYGGHAAAGGAFTIMRFPEADVVYMEHLTGAHYIDKQEEVEIYVAVMERLSVAAMSPEQTREVLVAMLKEI